MRRERPAGASAESILMRGLETLSLPFTSRQVGAFMVYLEELRKWSKAYNLTSLKSDEDIVIKHFLDSLLYLRALPGGKISVLDVGSGAGFPGLPLKIMRPGITMYLLEPSRKKANFLRHVAGLIAPEDTRIIEKRIEDLEELTVDVALTRALFDIGDFYKKAASFVKKGGRLVLSKGPKVGEELATIGKAGIRCQVTNIRLPLTHMNRSIVVIEIDSPGREGETNIPSRQSALQATSQSPNICFNTECRLRKAGCRGFGGCPGYKSGT